MQHPYKTKETPYLPLNALLCAPVPFEICHHSNCKPLYVLPILGASTTLSKCSSLVATPVTNGYVNNFDFPCIIWNPLRPLRQVLPPLSHAKSRWGSPKTNHNNSSQLHLLHFSHFSFCISATPFFLFGGTASDSCFSRLQGTFRIFRIIPVSG